MYAAILIVNERGKRIVKHVKMIVNMSCLFYQNSDAVGQMQVPSSRRQQETQSVSLHYDDTETATVEVSFHDFYALPALHKSKNRIKWCR